MAKSSQKTRSEPAKKSAAKQTTKASKAAATKRPAKETKSAAKKSAAKKKNGTTYRKNDEVRALILTAAEQLFGERLPADVSVRDIAQRAGVQHSLVHRHFDTKERLLAEVIIANRTAYADAVAATDDPAQGYLNALAYLAANQSGPLALISAKVSHSAPPESQSFYPGFERHLDQLLGAGAPDDEHTRILTVMLMALVSGWCFLEDYLIGAAHLEKTGKDAVRAEITETIDRLINDHLKGKS